MSEASKQMQRPRRLLAACHRCHKQKIKCSGELPCRTCLNTGRGPQCQFPTRERRIRTSESYLRKLEEENQRLRAVGPQGPTPESESVLNVHEDDGLHTEALVESPALPSEERNLFNPLFDRQPDKLARTRSLVAEPGFIGESSCAAFSNRLLQCLDESYIPSSTGVSNYLRMGCREPKTSNSTQAPGFPERMHVKLLLNVARRYVGNYHPLFLEVTFMREVDAVYRREFVPSTLWLCKFYSLMALGEMYTNRRGVGDSNRVPGTNYYTFAVDLFQDNQDYFEEPSLIQVEILTLFAWAANVLGRIRTAYCYCGLATRLALSLGMHRSASRHANTLPAVELESRRRTWWVLYFFDRFTASKLGQPLAIRDEDIDVEMPSMDNLTTEEKREFQDPQNLIINIKLAQIIGNILIHIYGIPKATNGLYIHQVHGILTELRTWHDRLPPEMRIKERGTPRPVTSLHLAYNQSIMQTTRPVLLHLFKTKFQRVKSREETPNNPQPQQHVSPITLALAESCVHAAKASSRIVEGLFLEGSLAIFGYWDAHHIFSAAMILIMSAAVKPNAVHSDHLETLLSVLRSLKDAGNIPAVDFCERLAHIQQTVSTLSPVRSSSPSRPRPEWINNRTESENFSHGNAGQLRLDPKCDADPAAMDYGNFDVLGDPLIGSFLDRNQVQWLDLLFPDGTGTESLTEGQFLFGS